MDEFSPYEFALTQAKASARGRRLKAVSQATGLGISWLYKFSRGRIPNAGYQRVGRLVEHYRANPETPPPELAAQPAPPIATP